MFISQAMAQVPNVAPQASVQSAFGSVFMLVLFMAVFYFFVYKPQAQQVKKQKDINEGMKKGDVVVCASGIVGKIVKVHSEQIVLVEISDDVVVRVERDKIAEIIDKKHYVSLAKPAKKAAKATTKK